MVGTKKIIARANEMLHKDQALPTESSEESFTFNMTLEQEVRIQERRTIEQKLILQRKGINSRERLEKHRKRFAGCGFLPKTDEGLDEDSDKEEVPSRDSELKKHQVTYERVMRKQQRKDKEKAKKKD